MKKITYSICALSVLFVQAKAQSTITTPPVAPPVPTAEAYVAKNNVKTSSSSSYQVSINGNQVYSSSSTDQLDDPQRKKTFSKSYNVGKGDKVNISNVYGTITVKTWDKNEVKLDADINAFANNDSEAQQLIDNVNITSSKSGDETSFKTQMENRNGNWGNGSRNGKKWRREVKIYITVYLPSWVALTASQQYGNIEMVDFSGPTALTVQYGKLNAGDLRNSNNFISAQYASVNLNDVNKATIKQQYGSGLTIASANNLNINAQYATVKIGAVKGNATIKQQYGSGLSIASAENLDLDAQYAAVKIGTVKNEAHLKLQYGSGLTIDNVDNLSLTSQYAAVRIGKLTGLFTAKSQYGGRFSVEQVLGSSKTINLDTEYMNVALNFANNYTGNLNVNTSYSNFKAGDNVNAKKTGDDKSYSSSKEYTGTVGRGGSSNIQINAKYGSVTLN